jgi:uncharacterized membrane protein
VGLGMVAGMRTLSAPALVTRVARKRKLAVAGSKLGFLNSTGALSITALLAAGELIADKLPAMPNRTDLGPLLARAASGGLCGAVLCSAKKRSPWLGAFYGALGALGAAYAAYHLRRSIKENWHLPDSLVALAEDAVVASGGMLLASQMREEAA